MAVGDVEAARRQLVGQRSGRRAFGQSPQRLLEAVRPLEVEQGRLRSCACATARVNSGPARCSSFTSAGGAWGRAWCQISASTRSWWTASCPRTCPCGDRLDSDVADQTGVGGVAPRAWR